jgi:hypothetical protein
MTDYLADVRRYDACASEGVVEKIVKHLGIALRNPDASSVHCGNPKELERVKEKWAGKKLGAEEAKADIAIEKVCETMAGDEDKSRVTFYYLVAKQLDKIGEL